MINLIEKLSSKYLNCEVDIGIVKPDIYNKIFIMLHGYGGSIAEINKFFPLADYAKEYNMIIITPELGNKFYLDRRNKENNEEFIVGDFLSKELPEYIMKLYNMAANTEVILGGYSMGGFGSILNGFKNPNCFKALISVSGAFISHEIAIGSSFVVGNKNKKKEIFDIFMISEGEILIDVLSEDTERNPDAIVNQMNKEQIEKLPSIFLTCGTKDIWYSTTQHMRKVMLGKNIPFSYYEIDDGRHDFKEFDIGFRFAFDIIMK